MKYYVLLASLLAAILCSHAQTIIRGTVKDMQTMAPLSGASISMDNTSVATTTDTGGKFTIRLKRRPTSLTITSIGYLPRQVQIPAITTDLQIVLVPSSSILNTVEVFGQRDRTVNVISSQELRRYSGLNLQDVINAVPGLNMQSRTPWGGQHIIIRGYYPSADNGRNNSENFAGLGYQLFINNIPVTDATGTTVMDDIDFLNLASVEVIKGPSPLYGNYIAGAVNLFTPKPVYEQTSLEQQAIAGSYGLFRTNTIFQTSSGRSAVRLNYGHQTYDGFRPNDGSVKDYLTATADFAISHRNSLSAYFSYNSSHEQLAGEIDSADFYSHKAISNNFYVLNSSHANIESQRAGITDKYQFNDFFGNQTTIFVSGSSLDQAYAHGFSKNQNMSFGGRSAFTFQSPVAGISGTLGLAFQKTNQQTQGNFFLPFVSPPFTPSTPHNIPSAARNYAMNYDVFTQWKFDLPAHLVLTAGAGLNFLEFGTQNMLSNGIQFLNNPTLVKSFKPVLTPGIVLTKNLGAASSIYASVNRGYAPATLSQITSSAGIVNAALKPESAIQFELGTKGSTINSKLAWQASLFDMEITDRLIQQSANSVTFYTNAGLQRNLGAEAYMGYALVNNKQSAVTLLRPWLSYTFSHFRYIDFKSHGKNSAGGDTVVADFSGKSVAAVPENMVNVGLDFSIKAGLYFNTVFRYQDKVPVTFDNNHYMKAYNVWSAKVGYQRQVGKHLRLDLYAGAENLLSRTFYRFIFVGQNIQELAQGNDPYIPGGNGDGYILPAPFKATFYGGTSFKYIF